MATLNLRTGTVPKSRAHSVLNLFVVVGLAALSALLLLMAPHPALAADADSTRVNELGRKVDALVTEVERLRLGTPADTATAPALKPRGGRGDLPPGLSFGGYGEVVLTKFDRQRQDGTIAGELSRFDLLRNVVYVGYRFSDAWLFDSELEWEHSGVTDEGRAAVDSTGHGGVALSGESTVEFAFIEWRPRQEIGFRAGKLLVPIGVTNETHEPPTRIGALRPDAETLVIPTTWSETGAGIVGDLPRGVRYRAYAMTGLDGARFEAASAIREGRQAGFQAIATRPAGALRLECSGLPWVRLGASYYAGHAWQREQSPGQHLDPIVRLSEIDARADFHSLDVRALYVRGTLSQAVELSDAIGLTGMGRLGDAFFGGYIEAACDVLPAIAPGAKGALRPYSRFELSDTQDDVLAPGFVDPSHHVNTLTLGLEYQPLAGISLKAERQQRRNETRTEVNRWNVAIGWAY